MIDTKVSFDDTVDKATHKEPANLHTSYKSAFQVGQGAAVKPERQHWQGQTSTKQT